MKKSYLLALIVVTWTVLLLWVAAAIGGVFFVPCIYDKTLVFPARAVAISSWAAWFTLSLSVKVNGTSTWAKIYRGEVDYVSIPYDGARGVCYTAGALVLFAGLIGFWGLEVFAFPIGWFAHSTETSEVRVNDISYYRNSYTHTYNMEVEGDRFSGTFLWTDRDPALAKVNAAARASSHDIACLALTYRPWHIGAVVDSINPCH